MLFKIRFEYYTNRDIVLIILRYKYGNRYNGRLNMARLSTERRNLFFHFK